MDRFVTTMRDLVGGKGRALLTFPLALSPVSQIVRPVCPSNSARSFELTEPYYMSFLQFYSAGEHIPACKVMLLAITEAGKYNETTCDRYDIQV